MGHARNHSDGDKKQPTCASKGRKERGRNWWHPCSGTTHLGYEEKLNSYGAASLAERSDKPVDMVLEIHLLFVPCLNEFLSSCPDDAASSSPAMSIEWRSFEDSRHRWGSPIEISLASRPFLTKVHLTSLTG